MIARTRPSCKGAPAESLEESILPAFREYRRWKRLQLAYEAAHDAPSGSVMLMLADGQRNAGQALLRAADAFIEGEGGRTSATA